MPIKRAVIRMKDGSRHVCLPKSWVEYIEETSGGKVNFVLMDINDTITITPVVTSGTEKEKGGE